MQTHLNAPDTTHTPFTMEDTQHVPGDLGTPAPDPKAVVIEKGTLVISSFPP